MSPYLFVNITSAVCCFLFLIFLFISYFTRKNMNNIENKIYKRLLITNALCVVSYICFYVVDIICFKNNKDPNLYKIVYFFSKIAPIFILAWGAYFVFYAIVVTNELNEKFRNKILKNEKIFFLIFDIYIIIVSILHIMEKSVVNISTATEYGMLYAMNFSSYFDLGFVILLILFNRKKTNKKKILPLLMIIPIVLFACVLVVFPIVFVFVIITLIDHLMFHTIENPDVKLINELTLAKTQAEQASNAKSDFLSSMSHELRTPLNAIIGLSEIIQQESDKEEVKEDAVDIYNSSNNLLDIVDGILDINKIDSNKMELEEVEYNPTNLFEDIKKKSLIRLNGKDIDLIFNIPSLPNKLFGDKNKVNTIVNNLMSNSIKYTDKGKIQCSVVFNISKDIANFNIKVSDTGRGIDDDSKELLFTRFNRREEDKDSNISGTGLGLFLTKSLLDIIGGKIDVSSEEGFGSTFTINFSQKIVEENDTEIL